MFWLYLFINQSEMRLTEKQLDGLSDMADYYRVSEEVLMEMLDADKKEPKVDKNRGPLGKLRDRLFLFTGLEYGELKKNA